MVFLYDSLAQKSFHFHKSSWLASQMKSFAGLHRAIVVALQRTLPSSEEVYLNEIKVRLASHIVLMSNLTKMWKTKQGLCRVTEHGLEVPNVQS